MEGLTWRIESLEDGWAELRQSAFLFVVPVEELPSGIEAGDTLDSQGGSRQTGYPVFRRNGQRQRRATA